MEQALANLIENAFRHGMGAVRLWARSTGQTVELHVTDSGTGPPAEFLPQAFERRPDGRIGAHRDAAELPKVRESRRGRGLASLTAPSCDGC